MSSSVCQQIFHIKYQIPKLKRHTRRIYAPKSCEDPFIKNGSDVEFLFIEGYKELAKITQNDRAVSKTNA
jgi:hypothetical protein